MTGARIGNYVIERELGRGGMGVVSLARHAVLGTHAVVKQLVPELTGDETAVQRFITEAQAAAALKHPNIVQVIDCGQATDQSWYIVLEYLDGAALSSRIRQQGPSDIYSALEILAQAGGALHAAHRHGIVHRDVKPDNIFLTGSPDGVPHVTLLDFGIAKLRGDRPTLTRTGIGMGTPAYMPPEQLIDAKDVDVRADVYALGVVAFEMITGGHLPWKDTVAPAAIYARQMQEAPPDARQFFSAVPPAWALVIQRAMAPNADDRWPSMRELILALAEATPGDPHCPEGGAEIVRRHAPDLLTCGPSDDTVGSRLANLEPVPSPSSGRPTPFLRPPQAPSATPAPAVAAPSWSPPASEPLRPTTLGAASGQSGIDVGPTAPPSAASRRLLPVAAGAVIASGIALAVIVSSGGGSPKKPAPAAPAIDAPAAAAPPSRSALAIVTEPAGAVVAIDGVDRGTSPLNVPVPVGQRVTIEARLAGHGPAREVFTASDAPSTVRLTLAPLAVPELDAAIDAPAPAVDAGRARPRPARRPDAGPGSSTTFDPDAVGGGQR